MQMPISHDFNDLLPEYLKNGWYLNHYRAERGLPLLDGGRTVVVEGELATDEERRKLKVYNELYLPFGFPGFAMVGVKVHGNPWVVPFLKGEGQGHFDKEDAQHLRQLAPHFRRMIAMSETFVAGQARAGLGMLDALSSPAILLDWRGCIVGSNMLAEALMGDDLVIHNGRLSATERRSNQALQRLIAHVVSAPAGSAFLAEDPVVVLRSGRRPLLIDAMPTTTVICDAFRLTRAIIVITDLEKKPVSSERRLQRMFGLTLAEARLAALLATGLTLREASATLGITYETARTELKRVFAKLDVSRQSELVALLGRLS
jgi:DNA-binding CsgD family transcriptional regulator